MKRISADVDLFLLKFLSTKFYFQIMCFYLRHSFSLFQILDFCRLRSPVICLFDLFFFVLFQLFLSLFPRSGIFLQFLLHVSNSIGIEFAFNLICCVNDVKFFQEIVKTDHWHFEVIKTYTSIIIKIESHPLSLNINLDTLIGFVNIFYNLWLFLSNNIDIASDSFGGIIVHEEHVLYDWSQFLINHCVELSSMLLHDREFII